MTMAILTYVFFPVSARHDKTLTQSSRSKSTVAHTNSSVSVASQRKATHVMAKNKKKTTGSSSSSLAKANTRSIEPNTTLRMSQTRSHSGPPSKMYGGL